MEPDLVLVHRERMECSSHKWQHNKAQFGIRKTFLPLSVISIGTAFLELEESQALKTFSVKLWKTF